MKKFFLLMICALALVALPAHGQGGCVQSPENPTLILAGLAGGAYTVSAIRIRIRARRSHKQN
jgi:XrtJ-associated TM-motif-TM protein